MDDQILDLSSYKSQALPSLPPFPFWTRQELCLFIGPFSKARGLENKQCGVFWSGWRMTSQTLVPLLLYVQVKLGLSNAISHVSMNLGPKWNGMGEMIKDHVFFCTGFFISGWMCLICCNNLFVKMNRYICIDNQPIYSGLFFWVFACCILKN